MTIRTIPALLALAAGIVPVLPASGQDYPAKTVRVIVAFTPGGGNDIVARILSKHLSDIHKKPPQDISRKRTHESFRAAEQHMWKVN